MGTPAVHERLVEALRSSQRLGYLGDRPIDEVVEHARAFVRAVADVEGRLVDLGSGGGVPGLVIAADRPDLRVTLLDRRTARTDHLRRLVGRLGWRARVDVVDADAQADDVTSFGGPFDAAVARGLGPPESTLRIAANVVVPGGVVVISEPPVGDRWDAAILAEVGVDREPYEARVARFRTRSTSF